MLPLFYQSSFYVYQSPSALSGAREERGKTERCCRRPFHTHPSPHRRLLPPRLPLHQFVIPVMHLCFDFVLYWKHFTLGKISAHLSSISTHLTSSLPIAATAKAIITFHPSIKHSQLWSISTLSPLCSTALNLKCLPSVSVSTYLSADKAILDWRVDDYYNRFHNAFQHYACVCVFCKWNRWEVIYSHCPCASLLHSS